jgi:hypothetical protein
MTDVVLAHAHGRRWGAPTGAVTLVRRERIAANLYASERGEIAESAHPDSECPCVA